MQFLPIFFDVNNSTCLVIGGGEVALRKSRLLVKTGARVVVVAPHINQELADLVCTADVAGEVKERAYQSADLAGATLVVVATDDASLNKQVSVEAKAQNIPINVADQPELCSFIFPSILDRSPIVVAISSGGASPVLARQLRARLETLIPAGYGKLAQLLGKFRAPVKKRFKTIGQRRAFWEKVTSGAVAELVLTDRSTEAETMLQQWIDNPETAEQSGEVYLVGGGPGDPDLLTFKALRLMQQADVVLYDRLVSPEVLALVRKDAEQINVGKARDKHTVPQGDINEMLISLAKQGKKVLRLKGGDPFIFGRGGEELEGLADAAIPFQVVPGITAASGCAAYAGIPLTHREYAQSVQFVTGHLKNNSIDLNWDELVHDNHTVVFYMGLIGLPHICQKLIEHGQTPSTPVALVQKGTTAEQKVIIGTLKTIVELVAGEVVRPPTLIIVGGVVNLSSKLAWYGE
ncbi:MAG: uroporphyrinogen-III C-methyltransferase [Pseudomonadales bacterium]|nr:uroporphyrinogen-III C-methyltransferase [Pseudomonadales bacterium]